MGQVFGDAFGLAIPADLAALRAGGEKRLTEAFHAFGTIAADDRVVSIAAAERWCGGTTGSKATLSLDYVRSPAALPRELFVKFSRNLEQPLRDRARYQMEPEVKLAILARTPVFPIAVPRCAYADFHHESGTGILITERIAYGSGAIEPHRAKGLDYMMPEALGHYRALVRAIARLAGTHRSGRLPSYVEEAFPFDPDRVSAADPLPPPEKLERRIGQLQEFARKYPKMLPPDVAAPSFMARFAEEAKMFVARGDAVKRVLQADPDLIALNHWNANIDNAWFWRTPDGDIECGLLDWGGVGQMNVAAALWGCLSGAETRLWDDHLDGLLAFFAAEFHGAGGGSIDPDALKRLFALHVAMMGLAWLLDVPSRLLIEIPDLDRDAGRFDPRIAANEVARSSLLMMGNFLNLWRTTSPSSLIDRSAIVR